MSRTVHMLRDLLIPNGHDARCFLGAIDETGQGGIVKTSSFTLQLWKPERLPPSVTLCKDLPTRMLSHLGTILDEAYSNKAAGTTITNHRGRNLTPSDVLERLRDDCTSRPFPVNFEEGAKTLSQFLLRHVSDIYHTLTGTPLECRTEQHTSHSQVVSDFTCQVAGRLHILGQNKSPKVFNRFIGELMQLMEDESTVQLCDGEVPTRYVGYKAILGKLGYHAGDVEPRVRWVVIFSGLNYIIIFIPRTLGKPTMFCSPIMTFCLLPHGEQGPTQPPIWSLLVYMLLVETLNVDDEPLRQKLGVVVPVTDLPSSTLGSYTDAGRRRFSGRLGTVNERGESRSVSPALTEASDNLRIQCLDASPLDLLLVNAPHPHDAQNQNYPFVHFDCYLGAGWSTVFASSKSRVVVKFAAAPKKDRAELIRQLSNEKVAYSKLNHISGWVVPRLYGEYEWYGGRALVLSEEGQSLSHLKFTSLSLIERLILFAEVYCMHYLGVEHGDLEPRNVLRKGSSHIFKIIDFGFSDVDHVCPGWRVCGELKEVRAKLQLDRASFPSRSMVLEVFKIRPVLLLILTSLVFVMVSGTIWELEPVVANTLIPVVVSFVQP